MQRAAFHRALLPSASITSGLVHPGILHKRLHSRTRTRPTPCQPSLPTSLRADSPSPSPTPAARLSTAAAAAAAADATPRNRSQNANNASVTASEDEDPSAIIYVGPLTQTFRRLKIFSLSSLALASSLSPFIFIVESSLPSTARAALAATALATSGVSTALVAWCGRPYVTALRRLAPPSPAAAAAAAEQNHHHEQKQQQQTTTTHSHSHNENAPAGIELTTLTLALAPRRTRVYDPAFLCDTTRAFARWELAQRVQLPPEEEEGAPAAAGAAVAAPAAGGGGVRPGTEETVAETLDAAGNVLGRWIVTWGENGEGSCRAEGRVETHFNVHEELLTTPIR